MAWPANPRATNCRFWRPSRDGRRTSPNIRATQSGVAHLAYAFGRPVIASAIGDLPEVVKNEVTGLLVKPGDADGLAAAMLRLLSDPGLAAKLGEAGENSVRDAWAVAAARVSEALQEARPQ